MKRTLAMLLCFALTASLAACVQVEAPPQTTLPSAAGTEPAETSAPGETTAPAQTEPAETVPDETPGVLPDYNIPLTAIALPRFDEGQFSYPNVTFLHTDAQVARLVLLDLRNRMEKFRLAQPVRVSCDPMRVDQSILSLVLTGETEAEHSLRFVTYDLVTGEPLELPRLLSTDASMDMLLALLQDSLGGMQGVYSWYADILFELFGGNSLPESWYFSSQGLCFYFMPYEVAPYSVTAVLPYEKLAGLIRDRYYPPELPQTAGQMQVIRFEDAQLSSFSAFAEVVLDDCESAYLLYPSDAVTELRISTVAYSEASAAPVAQDVIFATDILTPGQAVRIQYTFAGLMSTLEIRYISDGLEQISYLRLSDEDGSILLSSE